MLERWIDGEDLFLLKGFWEALQAPHSSVREGWGVEGAEDEEKFLGLWKVRSRDLHEPFLAGTQSREELK